MSRDGAECLINNATASEKIDSRLVNSGEFIYLLEDGSVFISNDIDLINAREPDRLRYNILPELSTRWSIIQGNWRQILFISS